MNFDREIAAKRLLQDCSHIICSLCSITVWWCRVGTNKSDTIKPHHHFFYEIHYVLDGSCEIRNSTSGTTLTRDQFIIIPPTFEHYIIDDPNLYKFVFGFEINFNTDTYEGNTIKHLFESIDSLQSFVGTEKTEQIIKDLLETSYYRKLGYRHSIEAYISLLIIEISNSITTHPLYPDNNLAKKPHHHISVENVIKYLESNITLNLSVSDVAKNFHVSSRHLNRIIKEETGKTVHDLICENKILNIKRLLLETDLSTSEIALCSGYSSEYSMSRFFSSIVGWTPAAFRKKRKQK